MVCAISMCVTFASHIEISPSTKTVSNYISLNSDLRSNLLRKTAITANFYFPAEQQESVCIRKKIEA